MDKSDVIAFFNEHAGHWDAEMIRSDEKINRILDNAGVSAGDRVLDVACGTGVLIPDYLARNVASVTGVDISPEMIRIASKKFAAPNVRFLCADAEALPEDETYDRIVIYNAFPHFPDPAGVIKKLSRLLKDGGTLTVAHGMSRAMIDSHHAGEAKRVSLGLMEAEQLAAIFARYLTVTVTVSDDEMYQIVGKMKKE